MMEPEHAAMVSNFARYANGVLGSDKFMEPELLEAPEIVIPEGASDPEFVPPCEDAVIRLYDRIWTNLLR
jgi:spermidine/putrescine transport system substrate-binding protein